MGTAYIGGLARIWPWMAAFACLALLAGAAAQRLDFWRTRAFRRWFPWLALAVSLAVGLALAWQRKAMFDDAFISFRYVRQFLQGAGLVFNVGERVEGYTNFLWIIVLAGLAWVTRLQIPFVAFYACLACFVGNVATIWALGRRLSAPDAGQTYVPLAAPWLATQYIFTCYATTGMETMFASWLVVIGAYFLATQAGVRRATGAGVFFILAALARPDHLLFYCCAGGVLLVEWIAAVRGAWATHLRVWRAAAREFAAFAAPAAGYAVYFLWRWRYYGAFWPNTFYARSVDVSYWAQGWKYFLACGAGEHLLLLAPVFAVWAASSRDPRLATFRRFAVASALIFTFYIVRVGGDFMLGRFFLPLTPLLLLGVEQGAHAWARGARAPAWRGIAAAAIVAATAISVPFPESFESIADESRVYRATYGKLHLDRAVSASIAEAFGEPVTVSANAIGRISYYSAVPLIDNLGLTDAVVARRRLRVRGRPGHERAASQTYLDARGVVLASDGLNDELRKIEIPGSDFGWSIYRYHPDLMKRLAARAPDVKFARVEDVLDAEYHNLSARSARETAELLQRFDHYYFSVSGDERRRRPFVERFIRLWAFEDGRLPPGTIVEPSAKLRFVTPAGSGEYEIENYQGETLLALGPGEAGGPPARVRFPPFEIRGDEIGFLVGSWPEPSQSAVVLKIDGAAFGRWEGNGSGRLQRIVVPLVGKRGGRAELSLENRSLRETLLFDMFYEAEARGGPTSAAGATASGAAP